MKSTKLTKSSMWLIALTLAVAASASLIACTSESDEKLETSANVEEMKCADLEKPPGVGDEPLGPPPGMPYIFKGTAYVNGEPAPEGERLYVKLVASRSYDVAIGEGGAYRDIIHGPVHEPDNGVPFVFCLGDPEGTAVMSSERIDYENIGTFKEVELDLNFPALPSELESQ